MSQQLNILLIDDDRDTQQIFEMVAAHHNQPLIVAEDSYQGLELLRTSRPDVVVIDLFMPGLDGYQVFERIQQEQLATDACIVATTAFHTSDTYYNVMNWGFKGLLAKPLQSSELMQQLEDFVSAN